MEPKYLTIQEVFNGYESYNIPIYQRNYAWEEVEISQLIQDIYDVYSDDKNYYLGSLIVHNRNGIFETIDGQQRLTTLNILACVLKHKAKSTSFFKNVTVNLKFDSRKKSNTTLQYFNDNGNVITTIDLHSRMSQAFEIINKKLIELFGIKFYEHNNFDEFVTYLLTKVKILRIQVPEKTDLNHYFEVMNNRGEQLEKHEILKASFLEVLSQSEESEEYRKTFNIIWEACSYMDRYVQYVFKTEYRVPLFGKYWKNLNFDNFDNISNKINSIHSVDTKTQKTDNAANKNTLANIVLNKVNLKENENTFINKNGIERFTPVTSFPHFLLQVLRITINSNVKLDDKKLIDQFKEHIFLKGDVLTLTKNFAKNLLKTKFLFDNYIVKRDYNNDKESWAILQLKKQENYEIGTYTNTFGDDNSFQNKLVHLQSMFHVSFPQANNKHWLSACLLWLYNQNKIDAKAFIEHLESLSNDFYFNRLNGTLDYHKIVFNKQCPNTEIIPSEEQLKKFLNIGTGVNNFIFNRLDYLLFYNIESQKELIPPHNCDEEYLKFNLNDFEFSFRSSVEHYAPQQPKNNDVPITNIDNFGNLCLISAKKNSELSNYSPTAKKEHYKKSNTIESLKQRLMMCYRNWDENTVDEHQSNMVALLNTKTTTI